MKPDELFANLERHLRNKDDIEMVLLKGHLILEQVLNQMLLFYIESETKLSNLNLTFSKKIDLLVALSGNRQGSREQIAQLREINRIRNKLAHELDFENSHAALKRWACWVVGYRPVTINRKRTYRSTLLKAFYLLSAFLCGMATQRMATPRR